MSVNATGLASAQAEVYASYKTDTSAKTESASKTDTSAKADTASKTGEKNESGVVYDKSDKSSDTGKATYSVNKMSAEDRAALVKQLKADQESRQQQLTNIVKQMMGQQATTYATSNDMWKFLAEGKFTADPDTIAESWSGIYGDPDSFRYNTALLNTADKAHALNCVRMTLTLLRESGPAYIPQLLLAVAVPFALLLLSGITIFHSSSSRAMKARCLLILSCLCPLGLCIAGGDFGRWFSICAALASLSYKTLPLPLIQVIR